MKKKTKNLILSIVVTLILLLTFTVTYAAFTYQGTTSNQQLILGDIYMHYNETNATINIDNMIPTSFDDYKKYYSNELMTTQSMNELSSCGSYFNAMGIIAVLDEGSTAVTFCQGTGTVQGGTTIQALIESASDTKIQDMLSLNIIVASDDSYVVNPVMKTQSIEENELYKCVSIVSNETFDEGSTAESFCQGTGTLNGKTLEQVLTDSTFLENYKNVLLNNNVISEKIEELSYFEFTISGKNTYKEKDIWYEILLQHGSVPEGKTEESRIKDEFLRFTLMEVDGEDTNILLNAKKYSDLKNKRIWVETINKNTTDEINKTYRLYMWIDENVVIGNVNQNYTMDEWNEIFASIKVRVTGDFNEKVLTYEDKYNVTDASCFTTEETTIYFHNKNMTDQEIATCVDYLRNAGYEEYMYEGEDLTTFCQGNGTVDKITFQETLTYNLLDEEDLVYFEENNIIYSNFGLSIVDYDTTCGTDVVIPKIINGNDIIQIGYEAFQSNSLSSVVIPNNVIEIASAAFYDNKLTSVTFEENASVTTISERAFTYNQLTSIVIPNSVIGIYASAFGENQLISVTFEENSKLEKIRSVAFYGSKHIIPEVTIPNSVTFLACNAFNSNVIIHKNENLTCITDRPPI